MMNMPRRIWALLLAPLPAFLLTLLLAAGIRDPGSSVVLPVLISAAISYGAMLVLGLPADLILRRTGRIDLSWYLTIAPALLWMAMVVLSLGSAGEASRMPGDNSPFAMMSGLQMLFSPLGIPFQIAVAGVAALTAGIYWRIAVQPLVEARGII